MLELKPSGLFIHDGWMTKCRSPCLFPGLWLDSAFQPPPKSFSVNHSKSSVFLSPVPQGCHFTNGRIVSHWVVSSLDQAEEKSLTAVCPHSYLFYIRCLRVWIILSTILSLIHNPYLSKTSYWSSDISGTFNSIFQRGEKIKTIFLRKISYFPPFYFPILVNHK